MWRESISAGTSGWCHIAGYFTSHALTLCAAARKGHSEDQRRSRDKTRIAQLKVMVTAHLKQHLEEVFASGEPLGHKRNGRSYSISFKERDAEKPQFQKAWREECWQIAAIARKGCHQQPPPSSHHDGSAARASKGLHWYIQNRNHPQHQGKLLNTAILFVLLLIASDGIINKANLRASSSAAISYLHPNLTAIE